MPSKRTKALDISQRVKKAVWERDVGRCIVCGHYNAMPNAHYIPRSQGGLGVEQNIVTLCQVCHRDYDQSDQRAALRIWIRLYLQLQYADWDEQALVYKKHETL